MYSIPSSSRHFTSRSDAFICIRHLSAARSGYLSASAAKATVPEARLADPAASETLHWRCPYCAAIRTLPTIETISPYPAAASAGLLG
jgi:hypothetical protein